VRRDVAIKVNEVAALMTEALVIEGHASPFRVEDLAGDVVRAVAFARTLRRRAGASGSCRRQAGGAMDCDVRGWARVVRGGLVTDDTPVDRAALKLVGDGTMDGLSIGFVATDRSPRVSRGPDLRKIELREISLVTSPMRPGARFAVAGAFSHKRVAA
jgi:phage head maturation protease